MDDGMEYIMCFSMIRLNWIFISFFMFFPLFIAHMKRSTALQSPERERGTVQWNWMYVYCIWCGSIAKQCFYYIVAFSVWPAGFLSFIAFYSINQCNNIQKLKLWLHLVRYVFRFFFIPSFSICVLIFYYCFRKDSWMHLINNRK